MKIKILAPVCAAVLAASSAGFSAFTGAAASDELNVFEATDENVRSLGRTYYTGDALWFGQTASGVEFQVTGTKVRFFMTADSGSADVGNPAMIEIYVDGAFNKLTTLKKNPKSIDVDLGEDTLHTVKLVKTSECAQGTVFIDEIATDGDSLTPTQPKEKKIEFIGDSITCGYGVTAPNRNTSFSTLTEFGTRTYAYKTAELFDADSSFVSFSGFGIVSGYTSAGVLNERQTVPQYYDKLGYSWAWSDRGVISDVEWDFSRYVPDLIVVNLGTNDANYTAKDEGRIAEYSAAYVDFLKLIREKNPDSEILCTLGIMGQDLYEGLEKAVADYTAETGDTKVNTLEFDLQDAADGYGADWHPSEITHMKAANKLAARINELYGWEIDESVDISPTDVPEPTPATTEEDTSSQAPESSAAGSESSKTDSAASSAADDTSSKAAESSSASSSSSSAASSTASSSKASTSSAASKPAAASSAAADASPATGGSIAVGASIAALAAAALVVSRKRKG